MLSPAQKSETGISGVQYILSMDGNTQEGFIERIIVQTKASIEPTMEKN